MRILVIGASGLLGSVLVNNDLWLRDEVVGVSSRDADIRDSAQVGRLFADLRPECAVLAAAYTDVDGCEKNPEQAHEVNCLGALHVAQAAKQAGASLVFLSTDYVFDGSKGQPYEPHDPVCPLNVYGHSKAQAEEGIRRIIPEACILRTSWLFGATGICFPGKILELAGKLDRLSVVDDQIGCPTFNRDLAQIIVGLVRSRAQGVVHATNAGQCSWYEFAREIVCMGGFGNVLVSPVSTREFPRPARRPAYSVLSRASMGAYGIGPRTWQEALNDYFLDREKFIRGQQELVASSSPVERRRTI
ncbi:MAG TPA: dTDP-4-dehydrorhamnose reductase [Candidatus Angelobacter sp.]|nr:dTDP-4-dehydrorhamnose reductase [Candidatus Angelobacter sp.]